LKIAVVFGCDVPTLCLKRTLARLQQGHQNFGLGKGFGLWAFFDLAKEPTQEHRMLPNTRGSSSHNHQHCQSLPVLLETVLDLYIKIF
jgi:hypothetical protein